MKSLVRVLCGMVLIVVGIESASAVPLGSGFTYQGQLNQNGSPVNGSAHLRFSLWDAAGTGSPPVGGSQIGASQLVANIPVSNGLFTVELNGGGAFGPEAFNGDARWLQIEVCADAGCGTLTVLSPRQALTGAPYSLGPWQTIGGNLSYRGNVGIGTTSPVTPLHVEGSGLSLSRSGFGNRFSLSKDGSAPFSIFEGGSANQYRVAINNNGNVGVGTTNPSTKLEVRGDVRVGSSGQYFATHGGENLRIIRGTVNADGVIDAGSGFTVFRQPGAYYKITYTTPFPGPASILATAVIDDPFAPARFAQVFRGTFNPANEAFVEIVQRSDGASIDGAFSFIVIGRE